MQDAYPENLPDSHTIEQFLDNLTSTSWHDEIITKATDVASKIPGVKAIILRGSLAKGEGDAFSDIDFYIIHDGVEEDSKKIMSHFMNRLSEIGNVLHYFTSTVDAKSRIIYFTPFVKFELNIKTKKKVYGWKSNQVKILYDPERVAKQIILKLDTEFSIEPVLLSIQNTAVALPAFCYMTAGYLVRGEWITALEGIRWVASNLLKISGHFLNQWDEGPRRAETRFPEPVLDYYWGMQPKDVNDIWNAIDVALDWYLEWLIPWFNEHSIKTAEEEVPLIRLILGKLYSEFLKKSRSE